MSKLSTKQRKGLRTSQFAVPSRRAFPIPDKGHAKSALGHIRYARSPAERAAIRKKAYAVLGRKGP